MSNALWGVVPAEFDGGTATVGFNANNGTVAKILLDVLAPASAVLTGTPSPLFLGGGSIFDIVATSSDAAAKDILLWHCRVMSTPSVLLTTTANTLGRATGTWVSEGYQVGETLMLFGTSGNGNSGQDGIPCMITSIVNQVITFQGTPLAASAGLTSGTRVCKAYNWQRQTVTAGSGITSGVASQQILGGSNDGSTVRSERKIGKNDIIAVSMQAAVSALPAQVVVNAQYARY